MSRPTSPSIEVPAPRIHVSVMSGFDARVGSEPVYLSANVERVVALLAVRGRPQLRITVASTLWMDTTTDRAAANLRTALWRARQSTGDLLTLEGHYVALASGVSVDLTELFERARRLIDDDSPLGADDGDPGSLAGDLLPGWDEEWITFERERLRQLRIHALESLCAKLSRCGASGRSDRRRPRCRRGRTVARERTAGTGGRALGRGKHQRSAPAVPPLPRTPA